jgi:hypothetical protein
MRHVARGWSKRKRSSTMLAYHNEDDREHGVREGVRYG